MHAPIAFPGFTGLMWESPEGWWVLCSADLSQPNPAGKGSPKGASPPSPNLVVLFYITLNSVCQVEGGGDSSRRAESSILKQKDR